MLNAPSLLIGERISVYRVEVDAIIVLDHERVYNDLVKDMPKFVKVSTEQW